MFSFMKPPIPSTFTNVMRRADILTNSGNIEGLKDLIKLIMRPVQSKHLLRAYTCDDHKGGTELHWATELGILCFIGAKAGERIIEDRTFAEWCWSAECLIKDKSRFPQLELSMDIVLPTPWHPGRIMRNIGVIGADRPWGPFQQDFSNHFVTFQYPLMIGWVNGGNHSIAQSIIAGQGHLIPDEVHDISLLIDAVEFNGLNWYSRLSGLRLGRPRYEEFGWCWEIARRIMSLQPSPFRNAKI